jgi:hypothetical protein
MNSNAHRNHAAETAGKQRTSSAVTQLINGSEGPHSRTSHRHELERKAKPSSCSSEDARDVTAARAKTSEQQEAALPKKESPHEARTCINKGNNANQQ